MKVKGKHTTEAVMKLLLGHGTPALDIAQT